MIDNDVLNDKMDKAKNRRTSFVPAVEEEARSLLKGEFTV